MVNKYIFFSAVFVILFLILCNIFTYKTINDDTMMRIRTFRLRLRKQ